MPVTLTRSSTVLRARFDDVTPRPFNSVQLEGVGQRYSTCSVGTATLPREPRQMGND